MNRIKFFSFASAGGLFSLIFSFSCSPSSLKGTTDSSPTKPAPTSVTSANPGDNPNAGGNTTQPNPSSLPNAGNQNGSLPGGSTVQPGTLTSGAQGTQIDPTLHSDEDAIRKCLSKWNDHTFKVVNAKNYKHINVSVGADVGTIANDLLGKNLGGLKVPSYSVNGVNDTEATPEDKLIVVELSLNWGNTRWQMLNPRGWYCIKGAVALSNKDSKVTVRRHCTAHVAGSDLNINYNPQQNKLAVNDQKAGGQLGFSVNSQFIPESVADLNGTPCP